MVSHTSFKKFITTMMDQRGIQVVWSGSVAYVRTSILVTHNKIICTYKNTCKMPTTMKVIQCFSLQITVQYRDTPPQVFIPKLNRFIRENQPPRGFSAHITWERVISEEEQEPEVNLSKNRHRIHWIYFI